MLARIFDSGVGGVVRAKRGSRQQSTTEALPVTRRLMLAGSSIAAVLAMSPVAAASQRSAGMLGRLATAFRIAARLFDSFADNLAANLGRSAHLDRAAARRLRRRLIDMAEGLGQQAQSQSAFIQTLEDYHDYWRPARSHPGMDAVRAQQQRRSDWRRALEHSTNMLAVVRMRLNDLEAESGAFMDASLLRQLRATLSGRLALLGALGTTPMPRTQRDFDQLGEVTAQYRLLHQNLERCVEIMRRYISQLD